MNGAPFVALWVLVTIGVGASVCYFGLPVGRRGASLSAERAIAVATIGTVVAGLVGAIGALIPVIGLLLAPLAWIGVVGWLTTARWPIATAVGLSSWALSLVAVSALAALL